MNEKSIISVDTETSSLDPIEADLIGISFSHDVNEAYYILLHINFKSLSKEFVIKKLKNILESSIKKLVKIYKI